MSDNPTGATPEWLAGGNVSLAGGTVTALPSGVWTVTGNDTVTVAGGNLGISSLPAISVQGGNLGISSLPALAAGTALIGGIPLSLTVANPSCTLQLTSQTTLYGAGTMIGSSSVAGTATIPSFTMPTVSGGAGGVITKLRISCNDTVTTGWPNQTVQVALYTGLPTLGSGDRAAYSIAGGSASHLGDFSGTFGAMEGDGCSARLVPNSGVFDVYKLASGATVYAVPQAVSATGATGASATMTLIACIFY